VLETTVDFAAVGRVAKHTELRGVRVIEIAAQCNPKVFGTLQPKVDLKCAVSGRDASSLEVTCNYTFTAHSDQALAAEATIGYLLLYELNGAETFSESDVLQFAQANGALHSWPFVRELLHSLTSRMGYPPFTLPVMHFQPKAEAKAPSAVPGSERADEGHRKVPQETE
jgi:preprotein translocase subunit SecB